MVFTCCQTVFITALNESTNFHGWAWVLPDHHSHDVAADIPSSTGTQLRLGFGSSPCDKLTDAPFSTVDAALKLRCCLIPSSLVEPAPQRRRLEPAGAKVESEVDDRRQPLVASREVV
jgi:hypothetical protein